MLPLLEIEKVSQKKVIKTQNVKSENEIQSEGFAEIFNFLSSDKNSKKTESKSKGIPTPKAQEDSKKDSKSVVSLKGEKLQSNILKSLDEKYNLSQKFLDSQKAESQGKSLQMQNTQKVSLPVLSSAKDLLEYSKAQKQEAKTLKKLGEVAESLKLNLQKISAQIGEEQSKAPKSFPKQEVLPKNFKESLNAKENPKTTAQKSTKESPNILSSLLQDKELIEKADKTSKINQPKTEELKETKTTNKDSNVKIQGEVKEEKNLEKNLKDSKEAKEIKEFKEAKNVESQSKEKQDSTKKVQNQESLTKDSDKTSKINQPKTEESKEAKTTNKDSNVKIQNEVKEEKNLEKSLKDSKEAKEIKEFKEAKIVESQSKEKQDSNKKVQNQEILTKDSDKTSKINQSKTEESKETKTTNKDSNVKIQNEVKEEKNLKDSKEAKEIKEFKEAKIVESQSKEKQDSNKKVQNQEILTKKIEPKEKAEQFTKEQPLKVESPQSKTLQEPSKQEFAKESTKEFVKKEETTQEKVSQTPKEAPNKESQSPKTSQKVVQDSMQNPFAFKEKKEIKDSLLKDEKADNKNAKGLKDSATTSTSPFATSLKEESIKQEVKQQDIFLDNLLKTTEKSMQSSKETLKEVAQEGIKEHIEKKAKANQEIYQSSTQAQVENRLSVQNTFLHFSDKLRDALQNYRPPVTKISLELNPENLGSVELTIAKNGDKLSVQISSNPNALQLFMQNVQEFKNSLNNLGFQDVNLDFKDNAGNSLGSGDFGSSSGGEQGNFEGQNQRNPNPQEQNLEQDFNENPKNTQNWNENSLHIYKEVNNPYAKVALVEINFSYYA